MFYWAKSKHLFEVCGDFSANGLHLLCIELEVLLAEVHITFGLHRDEMNVGMGNFKTHHAHTDLYAGDSLLDGGCHALSENDVG